MLQLLVREKRRLIATLILKHSRPCVFQENRAASLELVPDYCDLELLSCEKQPFAEWSACRVSGRGRHIEGPSRRAR